MTDEPLQATVTQRGVVFAPTDQVLIVRRATDGGWELPGGRVDRGERARCAPYVGTIDSVFRTLLGEFVTNVGFDKIPTAGTDGQHESSPH
ncbi:NUDIX domain-containing protein [Halobaculum roseum]|uniref:NUDIX domain-containing protein n=1 Tax=Halobaculum roseum TaxID=2175149 RepID=A0ABD5MQL5_9EURY|nr:NUDIX hydrolase [Halobaculum roseum]QZY03236.1 NUDIX hydrolase [Halobaculum roseum]